MDTNKESLLLASKLRNNGIKVIIEMNKRKVKKALESANKNSIPYVIIIGQNEIDTNTIELKDMNNSKSIKINLDNTNEIVDIIKNKH
jgi:histidyl-tRNA synthetase